MALSHLTELDTTLVKIVCESGLTGFGEVCPLGNTYQPAHPEGARGPKNDGPAPDWDEPVADPSHLFQNGSRSFRP
jgi:L-alanine-DL-glutamate epimerase-like enolase superfamily enzyme